jgi:hypothetical protein
MTIGAAPACGGVATSGRRPRNRLEALRAAEDKGWL